MTIAGMIFLMLTVLYYIIQTNINGLTPKNLTITTIGLSCSIFLMIFAPFDITAADCNPDLGFRNTDTPIEVQGQGMVTIPRRENTEIIRICEQGINGEDVFEDK